MTEIVLVFPYFNDGRSRAFKFPPLGLGYIASYLRQKGFSVDIVDCTFLDWVQALDKVKKASPRIVGVYSMLSMVEPALRFARELRNHCELLIAGGPMPSANPQKFLDAFDVVVQGEAELTILELLETLENGRTLAEVKGIHLSENAKNKYAPLAIPFNGNSSFFTGARALTRDLDLFPFPARDLYDNDAYREYYKANYNYTMTSMLASRGCPFSCDFCWRPDYGRFYRVRSPVNIVDEMEEVKRVYGFDRIWFADELFIANKKHVMKVCEEIDCRKLDLRWECLARVDIVDQQVAAIMKKAGCDKIIYGLESGDDRTLRAMNKSIKVADSRRAVQVAIDSGIRVGAFFILGYPGETNETMLNTISLASSLPLDYFSMTVPYPLPGTPLYERVKDKMLVDEWEKPDYGYDHKLMFDHEFSIDKLKYGMHKAIAQASLRKRVGPFYSVLKPWEWYTDFKFRRIN